MTETERIWAQFRLTHPELYTIAFRQSAYWPYTQPQGSVR